MYANVREVLTALEAIEAQLTVWHGVERGKLRQSRADEEFRAASLHLESCSVYAAAVTALFNARAGLLHLRELERELVPEADRVRRGSEPYGE